MWRSWELLICNGSSIMKSNSLTTCVFDMQLAFEKYWCRFQGINWCQNFEKWMIKTIDYYFGSYSFTLVIGDNYRITPFTCSLFCICVLMRFVIDKHSREHPCVVCHSLFLFCLFPYSAPFVPRQGWVSCPISILSEFAQKFFQKVNLPRR